MFSENTDREWLVYLVKYWLPVIVLLGFIFWMSGGDFTDGRTSEFFFPKIKSLFPGLSPEGVIFVHEVIRDLAHMVEFFFLGLLLSIAVFRSQLRISNLKKNVLIIVLLFVFSFGDELRQSLVALRKASLIDIGLDVFGGVMALIIVQRSKLGKERFKI